MEKNINLIIWRNYEVVKTIRCKGRVSGDTVIPLMNKTLRIECEDVEFKATLEQLLENVVYPIECIKNTQDDIDVDVFIEVEKIKYGMVRVEIGGVATLNEGDKEELFMNAMFLMGFICMTYEDELVKILNLFNAYKRKYRDIRDEISDTNILEVYDEFYEVVDAPIKEWVKRFKERFNP